MGLAIGKRRRPLERVADAGRVRDRDRDGRRRVGGADIDGASVGGEEVHGHVATGDVVADLDDDRANIAAADGSTETDREGLGDVGKGARPCLSVETTQDDEHRRPDRQPQGDGEKSERGDDPAAQAGGHGRSVGRARGGIRNGNRLAERRDETVADTAHGLDRRTVGPELAADLADVDVDRPRLAREVGAPDVL